MNYEVFMSRNVATLACLSLAAAFLANRHGFAGILFLVLSAAVFFWREQPRQMHDASIGDYTGPHFPALVARLNTAYERQDWTCHWLGEVLDKMKLAEDSARLTTTLTSDGYLWPHVVVVPVGAGKLLVAFPSLRRLGWGRGARSERSIAIYCSRGVEHSNEALKFLEKLADRLAEPLGTPAAEQLAATSRGAA